ncbi:hypothetical protein RND81_12G207200 [Saponaria officinalis]|uniref:Endonuclease/exonuclease/phosphatase domain-containing protein n=1 Tax=Saponaria officinalis TaxID=3572 RepID=A0AAW1HD80_SAPOF
MNLLSYNCQGLGDDPTVVSLKKLLAKEHFDVAVLVETKLSKLEMEGVVGRLRDFEGVYGDSVGRKAGVAIIWRQGVDVTFISSSAHHVDVEITGLFSEVRWRLTGFYGWEDNEEKHLSWQLLRDLKGLSALPWLVIGDFNQILYKREKKGGAPRAQKDMDEFRHAMDDCGLMDIGFSRETFTWWNKRSEPDDIFERLDRGIATPEWVDIFPALSLVHLDKDRSDHTLSKLCRMTRGTVRKKRRFKFEDLWVSSKNCEKVIKEAWGSTTSTIGEGEVVTKIDNCAKALINCLGQRGIWRY